MATTGGVRPVGGDDGADEVGRAGAVLTDAGLGFAGDAGQAVRRVGGRLLVGHRDEADGGVREQVQGVHEGGTDDAEHVGDALGHHGFDHRLAGGHFLLAHRNLLILQRMVFFSETKRALVWIPDTETAGRQRSGNAIFVRIQRENGRLPSSGVALERPEFDFARAVPAFFLKMGERIEKTAAAGEEKGVRPQNRHRRPASIPWNRKQPCGPFHGGVILSGTEATGRKPPGGTSAETRFR